MLVRLGSGAVARVLCCERASERVPGWGAYQRFCEAGADSGRDSVDRDEPVMERGADQVDFVKSLLQFGHALVMPQHRTEI